MKLVQTDGGRSGSAIYPTLKQRVIQRGGMRWKTVGDCAVRAVAIAFDIPYDEAFRLLDAKKDGVVYGFQDKIADRVVNGWRLRPAKKLTDSGRYLCLECRGGHVTTYIDGARHDMVENQTPVSKVWAVVPA
jgi:hypothetical protein